MTQAPSRALWLWAGALLLVLWLIVPLSATASAVAALATIVAVGWAWRRAGQRGQAEGLGVAEPGLPPAGYGLPVVLVCGDGLSPLFAGASLRTTAQGCYVQVAKVEQLPAAVAGLQAVRPEWAGQLSVMFVVNPGEHQGTDSVACRVRAFVHQLLLARRAGHELPLLLISHVPASHGTGAWFSWEAGQASMHVREGGACTDLGEWQRQAITHQQATARLHASVQLNSAAMWLHAQVLSCFTAAPGDTAMVRPLACAISLVASAPRLPANQWQQWLHARAGLTKATPEAAGAALPFPDPLLQLLPVTAQGWVKRRAAVAAVWMFTLAGAVALGSSAWQNTLLARQVTDDLRRHAAVAHVLPGNAAARQEHQQALAALRQDADRLDHNFRHGAPWALGLGLYHGNRLRLPVHAVVNAPPPQLAPAPVRLDSLSLFSIGSAQLKPESTQVLVQALVHVKAQPGWLIVIAGHTDASGSADTNLLLSRARAAAVRDWMKAMGGIPDSCFAVQGFGASQPIARNDTEHGRTANRRVDIRLVPEAGACAQHATASGLQTQSHVATF